MKKLLIAMTAAAVGTCAWATEGAGGTTPNYLNEDFSEWSLTAPWSYGTIKDGEFSALDAAGDGELTLADGKLSLNTGSKILRGALANSAVTIPDDGLFIESKVTFKDPSDTVPDLGTDGKFALFVLDNVESCETYNTEDNPNVVAPSTNLWALGGYAVTVDGNRTLETRAYKLKVLQKTQDLEQEIDSTWLAGERTVAIKAYNDVLDGAAVNGGFMVLVDGKLCSVTEVHKVVNGVISYAEGDWFYTQTVADYLGDANAAMKSTLKDRYTAANLILNKKPAAQQLASVDFQGQGVIDDVRVTEEDVGFGSDSYILNVVVDGDGITLGCDEEVVLSALNVATNITFTLATGWVLDGVTGESLEKVTVAKVNDTTYAVTPKVNGATVTIKAYKPAAYVGGTAYESLAKALENVTAGATIELADNVMVENESFAISGNITIDLMGKTIASYAPETLAVFEVSDCTLTITDGVGGGKVDGAIIGNEGAVYNLIGGSFKNVYPFVLGEGEDALTFNFPVATGFELINGYYVIKAGSSYTESEKLVEGEMTEDATAALDEIAEAIGNDAGDEKVAEYLANVGYNNSDNKVSATILATAKADGTIAVSVNNNLPLVSKDAEFVAEAVAADEGNVAAFEFKLMDGQTELTLTDKAKLENIIKVCTDLNTWVSAKIEAEGVSDADVKATVSNGKVKVQLKSKTGGKCFMKLKAE